MAEGIRNDRTPEILAAVDREVRRRLTAAGLIVVNRAKQLLSVEGTIRRPTRFVTMGGGKSRRKVRGGLIYGAIRSRPGEPPRLQTGRLRGSVASEVRGGPGAPGGLVVHVGPGVRYGMYLERGTRKMAPRPWLVRAFRETEPAVRRLLTTPIL